MRRREKGWVKGYMNGDIRGWVERAVGRVYERVCVDRLIGWCVSG